MDTKKLNGNLLRAEDRKIFMHNIIRNFGIHGRRRFKNVRGIFGSAAWKSEIFCFRKGDNIFHLFIANC